MSEGFYITKVVIIDSLESWENQTGFEIEKAIRHEFAENNLPCTVHRYSIEWPNQFEKIIENLVAEAMELGESPLLHIEMHGDITDGLLFSAGGSLTWRRLSELLTRLNEATGFNLVSVFSACYGAYFATQLRAAYPAPCYALIAPEDAVDPGELLGGFRRLYRRFSLTQDMGIATTELSKERLTKGKWFSKTADTWFYNLLFTWASERANEEEFIKITQKLEQIPAASTAPKAANLFALLKITSIRYVLRSFEEFFMLSTIPENAKRFSYVRDQIHQHIIPLIGARKIEN